MKLPTEPLPRLLYLSDVPVESSYHGSALLYRLLQNYPPDKLLIIEGNLRISLPARRLPTVSYTSAKVGWARPLKTRFSSWANLAYSFAAGWRVGAVERALRDFQPEAVVTVACSYLWLTAARYARKYSLPLHSICHDDWPRLAPVPPVFRPWLEKKFGQVYRQSASRLCVSPYMSEEYERRYGVKGMVLYPSRSSEAPEFTSPPPRTAAGANKLTVAYAGQISSTEGGQMLNLLAKGLELVDGRLLVFGELSKEQAREFGLLKPNIEVFGLVKSNELINKIRENADALFVPMSFDSAARSNVMLSFPSKLTDYTVVGLPLLIYGPPYSSAVRWANSNAGVAEIVTEQSFGDLSASIRRLASSRDYRVKMGLRALEVGRLYFSHEVGENVFINSLLKGSASPVPCQL